MRFLLAVCCVAILALVSLGAVPKQSGLRMQSEVLVEGAMRVEKVKDGLFVIRGPFVPCGTRGCTPNGADDGLIHEPGDVAVRVTPEGAILVDDKYPENVADVLEKMKSVTSQPLRYMLNSHHHGDHVSGNQRILERGIDIIAHRNIRENFLKAKQPGAPNIVFSDRGAVYLGGVEVQMLWLGRGHTNGDTVIYFPDLKTVHVGDLIIDAMPVIDYANGGSALEFVKTIDNVLQIDFDTMIPGHGRVMTKDDARAYRVRFQAMNDRAREVIRKGVSKDRFVADLRLQDFGWEKSVSTSAFMRSVDQYYDEIAATSGTPR